jgi:hypothetical protein
VVCVVCVCVVCVWMFVCVVCVWGVCVWVWVCVCGCFVLCCMCVCVCMCGSAAKVCVLISAGFTLKIISNLRTDKEIWTSSSATSIYVFQYTVSCIASGVAGYSSVILIIVCAGLSNNSKNDIGTTSTNTRYSICVFIAVLNFIDIYFTNCRHRSVVGRP